MKDTKVKVYLDERHRPGRVCHDTYFDGTEYDG